MKFEVWVHPNTATKDPENFQPTSWDWTIRSVPEANRPLGMSFSGWEQRGKAPTRELAVKHAQLMAKHMADSLVFMYDTDAQADPE